MEIIKIKVSTLNSVLEYLSRQPFKDVAGLISEVQKDFSELNTKQDGGNGDEHAGK